MANITNSIPYKFNPTEDKEVNIRFAPNMVNFDLV